MSDQKLPDNSNAYEIQSVDEVQVQMLNGLPFEIAWDGTHVFCIKHDVEEIWVSRILDEDGVEAGFRLSASLPINLEGGSSLIGLDLYFDVSGDGVLELGSIVFPSAQTDTIDMVKYSKLLGKVFYQYNFYDKNSRRYPSDEYSEAEGIGVGSFQEWIGVLKDHFNTVCEKIREHTSPMN